MNTNTMVIRPQLERAGSIDVHTKNMTVCIYKAPDFLEVEDFGTYTCDLHRIREKFQQHGIRQVILESTGIYWVALHSVLKEGGIEVKVVNASFVKNLPKEKTDKKDAVFLCKLLVNGQVRHSFVANEDQRAFRDLCRSRIQCANHTSQTFNRITKQLESRNIKIASVVSNMNTKSARAIVKALSEGETNIDTLLDLCKGRLKLKKEEMRKALAGVMTAHDCLQLNRLLKTIEHFELQSLLVEGGIKHHMDKVNPVLIEKLQCVPGIGPKCCEIILAEIGSNVDAWDRADKLSAWCGFAPGDKETGGIRKPVRTRKGNKHLRAALLQSAWGAVRTKNSYWRAVFTYYSKRMHANKAIIIVARKMSRIIYWVIKGELIYAELGAEHFYAQLQKRAKYAKPLKDTL